MEIADSKRANLPQAWSWGRIRYQDRPDRFDWSGDARTGARAAHFESVFVTQLFYQAVKARPGKRFVFGLYMKGRGSIALAKQYRDRSGRRFSPEPQQVFTLTDRWLRYEVCGIVPETAVQINCMVSTPRLGTSVWVDDAFFYYDPPARSAQAVRTAPAEPLIDVVPLCAVSSVPRMRGEKRFISDRAFYGGEFIPEHGLGRGAQVIFKLPRPAIVSGICLVQGKKKADAFLIDADVDGDGKFETTLVRTHEGGREYAWSRFFFAPIKVHQIRYTGIRGNYLYGQTFGALAEFQILCRPETWMFAKLPASGPDAAEDASAGLLTPVAPAADYERLLKRLGKVKPTFSRGVYVHEWMMGLGDQRPDNIEKHSGLIEFERQLNYVHADNVWCYAHLAGGKKLLWPSGVVHGTSWNLLGEVTKYLHQRGKKIFVAMSSMPGKDKDKPWRIAMSGLFREIAATGADGATICTDEWPHAGQDPVDPEVLKQEMERLQVERKPAYRQDTSAYRRAVIARYLAVAAGFKQMTAATRKAFPEFVFTSLWAIFPLSWSETKGSLAYDILASGSGLDYMCTDPYFLHGSEHARVERCIRMLVAGGRRVRGTIPVLIGGTWIWPEIDRHQVISLTGGPLAAFFSGARGVTLWRHNWTWANQNQHELRQVFRLIDCLDRLGVDDAPQEKLVAVLHGRAAEEFYQLRSRSTSNIDQNLEGLRGYLSQKIVEESLVAASVPHEIFYLDREEDVAEACAFKVIVLPFPYCISDRSAELVRGAVARGARVVICSDLGRANELGDRRPAPALKELIDLPGVVFVPKSTGPSPLQAPEEHPVVKTVSRIIVPDLRFSLARNGFDVEVLYRVVNGRHYLAVINWDMRDATVRLGLRLDPGKYAARQFDRYGYGAVAFKNADKGGRRGKQPTVTAAELKSFDLYLPRNGYKVLEVGNVQ